MKLRLRMLIVILSSILIILAGLLTYTGSTSHNDAMNAATSLALASGEKIAMSVKSELEVATNAARTLSDSVQAMKRDNNTDRNTVNEMLRTVLENNPTFLDAWMVWEPNAFDGQDARFAGKDGLDPTGRFNSYWVKSGSAYKMSFNEGYDQPGVGDYYLIPKKNDKESVLNPYYYKLDNVDVLMAGLVVPIKVDGKFVGAVGIDFKLEVLQAMMEKFSLYDTGIASIYSNDGGIVTSPVKEQMGKKLNEVYKDESITAAMKSIQEGKVYETRINDTYKIYTPITIGRSDTPWSVGVSIPMGEITAESNQVIYSTIAAGIIAVLLLGAVVLWLTNAIVKPITASVTVGQNMAKGDFTQEIEKQYLQRKDEIGMLAQVFENITKSMRDMIGQVSLNASQVAAASQQISASTQEIASGSTTQAQEAQNITELFKDLSSAINSIAKGAEEAATLSNQTVKTAEDGGKVVNLAIDGMSQVSEQMARLEQDSNKIGEIIEVIDDIAEQTNLLALNAAIEAARAGEQGRGFAVVADEVRKLAERSGEATKQITAIIKGMQNNTQNSVASVAEGLQKSQQTGEAFHNIIAMVNESASKVAEIAAASEEQSAQADDVLQSVETIASTSEEAAAASEQTASTSQSLTRLADDLNRSVSVFKV
jgi:methyl-accepting chemotaxis protein